MTNFIPGARLPAHVFDEENVVDCPDCHRPTEVDEGRRVHVNTGEIECGPKVYGYVKHNEYRILEIICNACVTPRERAAIRSNAYGILPVERPGTIVCRRCLEVA